jgi:DNA-binding SARP family transcriptional activator/tetratricopeptide (TPR) repeat protein
MQVRLLGPVDVVVDGISRQVSGLRRKAVLAALALQAGEIVSIDRLVDVVWGDEAPATAANTLQSHVSHLRGVLGQRTAILARAPGYVLTIDAEPTDVSTAERLIRESAQTPDPEDRETRLQAAVALWRGHPLADLTGLTWFDLEAQRLDRLLVQAKHALIDARLTLGQHAEVIPGLETLSRQHPLDEQIHRQLISALYRVGRQGDALATYQRLRRNLQEDLGIDPSQPLRDLEAAILRQDASLDTPQPPPSGAGPVPAQLPPAIKTFTGRSDELAHLNSLIPNTDDGSQVPPAAVVISAISGTAGIGKTTLATHWAHRVAARFPDGQLYVNLRGFDPTGSIVSPTEALRGFLDAFGIPGKRIPEEIDAQVGLYRSLLKGKRVLVVLDNARDVEHVRPLLPGSDSCMVIVTSRNQLTPLVASLGAHPVTLDLLAATEARDLLASRLGTDRIAREPAAVDEIIARCARLPLALAIAAARAVIQPDFPLAQLAAQLRDTTGTLDPFHGGDPATDIRAVLSWSYRTLSPEAARLFRLLSLHPGPDLTAAAAASLAAITPQKARLLLTELTRAHMLSEHNPGRYTFHDLLRAYATEQVTTHDNDVSRRAATQRTLDHYLHTAHTATLQLYPKWDRIDLGTAHHGVVPEHPGSYDSALEWFSAEYPVLVGVIESAATAGFDAHAWQLTWTFTAFLLRDGRLGEQLAIQHIALDAARRLDDHLGQALLLRGLGISYERTNRDSEASICFRQSLQIYDELGDLSGQAHAYTGMMVIAADRDGQPAEALTYALKSLELFRAAGDSLWEANALNFAGWCYCQLGDHQQAITYCTQSLLLLQELGDRDGEANTWDTLGYAHNGLGDHVQAANCYQHAIDLARDLGDLYYEADTLTNLGDAHQTAGNHDAARKAWQQAMDIVDQLNHPDADRIRAKLSTLRSA